MLRVRPAFSMLGQAIGTGSSLQETQIDKTILLKLDSHMRMTLRGYPPPPPPPRPRDQL